MFDSQFDSYEIVIQNFLRCWDLEKNQCLKDNTGDIFYLDFESYEIEN